MESVCNWSRKFDGHFAISCVDENGKRANGSFKPDDTVKETKWDFKYCPYCGEEIKVKDYK